MQKLPRELWIMILKIKTYTAVKKRLEKILEFPVIVDEVEYLAFTNIIRRYRFKTYTHFWEINYDDTYSIRLIQLRQFFTRDYNKYFLFYG